MPLWFWQEFTSDVSVANPNVFRFGEWIYSHPADSRSVEFANKAGMTLLDFGYCQAVRECFAGDSGKGFPAVREILDLDGNYSGATELVTFFENHDMPRLQSLGVSDRQLELALVLLLTSRGIPCLYYGCEQYLHNDTDGGDDPYNRPMMRSWSETEATRIIGILAHERKQNQAIQLGGQWPKWVDEHTYVYLRRYRDSRCLVMINKGPQRDLKLVNLDCAQGKYTCLLTDEVCEIVDGSLDISLPSESAFVFATRGNTVAGQAVIRLLVNGAPTAPGDRLLVIGDCDELGKWDLSEGYELECVNFNTWFGEVPFNANAGRAIGYKYVIFRAQENEAPLRENRTVRRRLVTPGGTAKWRDQ